MFINFFHEQVHYILQEIVMGGMVLETNMSEILTHIEAQNKLEKSEVRLILYSSTLSMTSAF